MEINIAEICGLCAGCKRAILTTKNLLEENKNVTVFKEIVHNKNVNNNLKNLGANFENDINNLNNKNLIIVRAHGEPPKTYEYFKKNKIKYVDCTCFNVAEIHEKVKEYYEKNYSIIIIGKHKPALHPEVEGTLGWSNNEAVLIQDEDDLNQIKNINKNAYLVCQTTFNIEKANCLIEKIETLMKNKNLNIIINKSICSANKTINLSSIKLAQTSNLMIVVGGKNSSNTKELYNNIKNFCPTIFVEYINDYQNELKLNNITINQTSKIGITAGASTMKEELESLKQLILKDYN